MHPDPFHTEQRYYCRGTATKFHSGLFLTDHISTIQEWSYKKKRRTAMGLFTSLGRLHPLERLRE